MPYNLYLVTAVTDISESMRSSLRPVCNTKTCQPQPAIIRAYIYCIRYVTQQKILIRIPFNTKYSHTDVAAMAGPTISIEGKSDNRPTVWHM